MQLLTDREVTQCVMLCCITGGDAPQLPAVVHGDLRGGVPQAGRGANHHTDRAEEGLAREGDPQSSWLRVQCKHGFIYPSDIRARCRYAILSKVPFISMSGLFTQPVFVSDCIRPTG